MVMSQDIANADDGSQRCRPASSGPLACHSTQVAQSAVGLPNR
jgi:hypothetical protein